MVLGIVAVAVAALALAQLAGRAQLMAQAQTAADAAALAGVRSHRAAASELAAANGAELTQFELLAGVARVEVEIDGESAAAAAEIPAPAMIPALAAALERASQILGEDLNRSVRLLGAYGLEGVEVSRSLAVRLATLSQSTGLCRAQDGRPLHFVTCPAIPQP